MAGVASVRSSSIEYPNLPSFTDDVVGQQEFIDVISNMRPVTRGVLPDLTPALPHDWSTAIGLVEYLDQGEDFVFLSDEFSKRNGLDRNPDRLEFHAQPVQRIGRKASRTNVFFGPLNGRYFHNGKKESLQIAVKRMSEKYFDEDRKRWVPNDVDEIMHEVAMYQYLRDIGYRTLTVVGIALRAEDNNFLNRGFAMTAQVDPLTTFDSYTQTEWDEMDDEEVESNLGIILGTATELNRNLLFHGDFATKNVTMEGVVVDVETMVSGKDCPDLETPGRINEERERMIDINMRLQFAKLAMSLDTSLFAGRRKPTDDLDRFEKYNSLIFTPYYELLQQSRSTYIDILEKACKAMIDRRAEEALYGYGGNC